MRRQKGISRQHFNELKWEYEDGAFSTGVFYSDAHVGNFTIGFDYSVKSGIFSLTIQSISYPELNLSNRVYVKAEEMLAGVNTYFDELEELKTKLSDESYKKARLAYRNALRREIKRIKEST